MLHVANWPTKTKELISKGKILCFLLYLCFTATGMAQMPEAQHIEWGEELSIPRKYRLEQLIGKDDQFLYVLLSQPESFSHPEIFHLAKYHLTDFTEASVQPLTIPRGRGEETRFEKLIFSGDQMIMIVTYFSSSNATFNAFGYFVSKEGVVGEDPIALYEFTGANRRNPGRYRFLLSADSTRLVVHFTKPYDKRTPQKDVFTAFNLSLEPLWAKSLEMPYTSQEVDIVQEMTDSKDRVYTLARITHPEKRWSKGEPNFRYVLFVYSHQRNELREFNLALKGRSISDAHMAHNGPDRVLVAGLFSDLARKENESSGMFYMELDAASQAIVHQGIQPFDSQLLQQYLSPRQLERGQELENFEIHKLLSSHDGGAYVVSEQYQHKRDCVTDLRTGVQNCTDQYYFNDLLISRIDTGGELNWMKSVRKLQYSANDFGLYSSLIAHADTGKLFMVYNDHPKNTSSTARDDVRSMTAPASSNMVQIGFGTENTSARKPLDYAEDNQAIFLPTKSLLVSQREMIVVARLGGNLRFGRLYFTE